MPPLDLVARWAAPRPREAFFLDHGGGIASGHSSVCLRGPPGPDTPSALLGVEETAEAPDDHKDGAPGGECRPLCTRGEWAEGGVPVHKPPDEGASRGLEQARDGAPSAPRGVQARPPCKGFCWSDRCRGKSLRRPGRTERRASLGHEATGGGALDFTS